MIAAKEIGPATTPGQAEAHLREALRQYLAETLGRAVEISPLERYPVGFSWVTYGFSIAPDLDGVSDLILRLGPGNGLYAPYSAEPQYAALAVLQGSAVPVPRAYFWSDDEAILGDPFFISEKAPGSAPIPWGGGDAMGDADRQSLGKQFADALGALHMVDWKRSGLAKFADGLTCENAAIRQVDQWEADAKRWALRPHPMLHRIFGWLRTNPPVAPRLSIIHGDYRLGNFLAREGRITAILDWELVHLGDPHEDLAWTCLPQFRGGTDLMSKLITQEDLYERHADRTGEAVNPQSMRYYMLFSLSKLAATHMAAAFAFERKGFYDMRMPAMGTQIAPVMRQIEKLLDAGS